MKNLCGRLWWSSNELCEFVSERPGVISVPTWDYFWTTWGYFWTTWGYFCTYWDYFWTTWGYFWTTWGYFYSYRLLLPWETYVKGCGDHITRYMRLFLNDLGLFLNDLGLFLCLPGNISERPRDYFWTTWGYFYSYRLLLPWETYVEGCGDHITRYMSLFLNDLG